MNLPSRELFVLFFSGEAIFFHPTPHTNQFFFFEFRGKLAICGRASHIGVGADEPARRMRQLAIWLLHALLVPSIACHLIRAPLRAVRVVHPRATARAQARPDFSGQWEMDLSASDPLGPILRELGLNRVLAALVSRVGVRQSIEMSEDALTVEVTTAVSTSTLRLEYDGSPTLAPGITGGETLCISRWLNDTRLETRQSLDANNPPNGDAFVTVRSLREDMLIEEVAVVRGGVAGASAQRCLRRVPPGVG
jgi:hypothetical protein